MASLGGSRSTTPVGREERISDDVVAIIAGRGSLCTDIFNRLDAMSRVIPPTWERSGFTEKE
jgi:hypothetical protein